MKYDAILYVDAPINEADERIVARKAISGTTKYDKGSTEWYDPRYWAAHSFGSTLRTLLNSMGSNYSSEITDFGKWITVKVTYHDHITGRSSSKTFLIVFKQKGDGIVMSTHNRYRTISGVDQAGSYIRSTCGSLQNSAQTKIG